MTRNKNKSPEPKRRCPECGAPVSWKGNIYRPFCSSRCKQVDLGKWLGEEYSLPVYESPDFPAEDTSSKVIH